MHETYWSFKTCKVLAVQSHCETLLLPIFPSSSRASEDARRLSTYSLAISALPGSNSKPYFPQVPMMSGTPPACAATTGTELAIASSTTKPRVSLSEGITKMSADAYTLDSSSPRSSPVKVVGVPLKSSFSSSFTGPSPTKTRWVSGCFSLTFSRIGLMSSRFFSLPSLPTYIKTLPLGLPPHSFVLVSSHLCLGLKISVSTALRHTLIFS
mmetsp:Transcript_272/g.667  ORF Transcript_272/g.667 Transcript_272/m.667 type:complete len:211 (+) Transcript_272:4244-4876(+)